MADAAPTDPDPATALAELGHRLELARRRAGLTYRDLEARTGMPRSTLHHLLHGRKRLPDYWVLVGLVSALGGSWDDDGWEPLWRVAAGPTVAAPERVESPVAAEPVPRQLPPALAVFAGREAALAELDAAAVVAVVGPGGVGKTSVVLQWAHQHAAEFPDGQLFADLAGFGPTAEPVDPDQVVTRFLGALGVRGDAMPGTPEARTATFRTLMASRRTLVVLDNARDSEQVLPLLPGDQQCPVLVTSRARLGTLATHGAHQTTLDVLGPEEAREVLRRRLGDDVLSADPGATDTVLAACAGLPLALAIVAARVAGGRPPALTDVAAELTDADSRLDALSAGEDAADLRVVLDWSFRRLREDDARLLRLLAVGAVPDLGVAGIAALAGTSTAAATAGLRRLRDSHLVEERRSGRFGLHDLVRLAVADDPPEQVEAAVGRLLQWLLVHSDAADRRLAPERRHALAEPVVTFRGYDDALAWCLAERDVVPRAAAVASTSAQRRTAWMLPRALWSFYRLGSDWPGFLELNTAALAAAGREGDDDGRGSALNGLGVAHAVLGDLPRGVTELEEALAICRASGDRYSERVVLTNLGDLFRRSGELERAVACCAETVTISRDLDDSYGECLAVGNLGLTQLALGRVDDALASQQQALSLARRIGDQNLEVEVRSAIGDVLRRAGRADDAQAAYRQAVDDASANGSRIAWARALTGLAELALDTGDRDAASAHAERAREVLGQPGDADTDELADRAAAVLAASTGG